MQSEHRLREELAAVLRDAGIGEIDDPDILDLDFEDQLGLGSIELAELVVRFGDAYGVELPSAALEGSAGPATFSKRSNRRPGSMPWLSTGQPSRGNRKQRKRAHR